MKGRLECSPSYQELYKHFALFTGLKKMKKETIPHIDTDQGPRISFIITKLSEHYPID